MTDLKEEAEIIPPSSGMGRRQRKIDYEWLGRVEGRNLLFEARYPRGPMGAIRKTGQVSIASAFQPGTNHV
jgi:hypothetical protein